jgi:hypothetical protein
MAAKHNARDLLAKAPYNKDTLYSSLFLGWIGGSHVDAEKTRYIGTKNGLYEFRDEAPPHHIVRKVPASGTNGAVGIVLHKDLEKIRLAPPPNYSRRRSRSRNSSNSSNSRNSSNNENNNARNRRKARKARRTRRAHGHNNNTENDENSENNK